MNRIGRSRLIRRVAGVLTGLAAALGPITTGSATLASQPRTPGVASPNVLYQAGADSSLYR